MQLSPSQLGRLEAAFAVGADDASNALAKWLSVPSLIVIESVEQRPFADAIDILGGSEDAVCFCFMAVTGSLTGHLILSFDDASGLSLADLLLNKPAGTSIDWGEVEQSAALETHNIIGCAYLNSLARLVLSRNGAESELVPSPPEFRRDFAESLLQALLMDQAATSETVFIARTRFELRGQPRNWTMLLVPDALSMGRLCRELGADEVSE